MGFLTDAYKFLFEVPPPPEPSSKWPTYQTKSFDDIMGKIGLADYADRLEVGRSVNLPFRHTSEGRMRPYIKIDVGNENDHRIRVSINHWDTGGNIHIHIRENENTGVFYFDKIDNDGRHKGVNHTVICDYNMIDEVELNQILNTIRTAVSGMRYGELKDLDGTHQAISALTPQAARSPAPAP